MKNLKQYQGQIWRTKLLENQFSQILQKIDDSRDETTSFFSGILSSFLSTMFTMILVVTNWVDNILSVALSGIFCFILLWIFIKKACIPILKSRTAERRKIDLDRRPKNYDVIYFNSYIVYSVLEMADSLDIIRQTNDLSCKNINTVLMVQEWCKCVQFICTNIQRSIHIRDEEFYTDSIYIKEYINAYVYDVTLKLLLKIGTQLSECELDTTCENCTILKKDLDHYQKELLSYIESYQKKPATE